ncbi:MAG: hypothetical protein GXY61_06545 [Lentisphaerae bacterium]|nr:hypothetical protein [Lentisphaerota bacterium]
MKPILVFTAMGVMLLARSGYSEKSPAAPEKSGGPGVSSFLQSSEKVQSVQTNAFPEPPATDASEPRRIVRYFCRAWKDEDYKAMYGAMDKGYRRGKSFTAFEALFENDKDGNGGLKDENIDKAEAHEGAATVMKVELIYRSKRAKPKKVVAKVIKTPQGYRLIDCGLLPIDFNDL